MGTVEVATTSEVDKVKQAALFFLNAEKSSDNLKWSFLFKILEYLLEDRSSGILLNLIYLRKHTELLMEN